MFHNARGTWTKGLTLRRIREWEQNLKKGFQKCRKSNKPATHMTAWADFSMQVESASKDLGIGIVLYAGALEGGGVALKIPPRVGAAEEVVAVGETDTGTGSAGMVGESVSRVDSSRT